MDQQQQQKLLLQQQQQQQQQQNQYLLLQQLQKQAHQQQQAAAISRFPSNIDAHLRSPGLHILNSNRPPLFPNPNPSSNSNSSRNPNSQQQSGGGGGGSGLTQTPHPQSQQQQPQKSQLQKSGGGGIMMMRPPAVNQAELQMAYQDAWRVCHPDFKRPFSSLEDACERLLPYHVVADYEAEEDDRILDSDTTGQMPSRCQQWDHNISAKVAEFTGTFEKQALAFNIITRKRALGEFRSEERLMIEQALLQEEKRILLDLKSEIDAREKAGREAQLRIAAMVQSEHARGPIRASALESQGNSNAVVHDMGESEHNVNQEEEILNGWGNNVQRDEKEPSEDFLNDEENENADTGAQGEWSVVGEFDLNTR